MLSFATGIMDLYSALVKLPIIIPPNSTSRFVITVMSPKKVLSAFL